jgi:hypothetical protein
MEEIILTNPISEVVKKSYDRSIENISIAVPFISSFSKTIVSGNSNPTKRLITRFDETNIHSFDLPSLKYLIENDFDIRFNNNIHLKLYILDKDCYVTSSNFTKGGFVDNTELTVRVDSTNLSKCQIVFNDLWDEAVESKVTLELIEENMPKYLLLKKQEKFKGVVKAKITDRKIAFGDFSIETIIEEVFYNETIDENTLRKVGEANKDREIVKRKLKEKFETSIFYAPENDKLREFSLFYNFVYGKEGSLAGTGLREGQFKSVFVRPDFKQVICFMFPEMIGMEPWNLENPNTFQSFCNGIFDFDIPNYSEALPIRLASYFYPEYFFPIFKLEHFQKICNGLGLETDATTKGEQLFVYNSFFKEKTRSIPYSNYFKSSLAYKFLYTIELNERLVKGEDYESIKNSYKQAWKKYLIENGRNVLVKTGAIV